jgi:hypothetical protein
LPDFSWRNIPKLIKNVPKRLQNIQTDHRMYQLLIKHTKFFNPMPSKIYKNWAFWFENIPSDNLGCDVNFLTLEFM